MQTAAERTSFDLALELLDATTYTDSDEGAVPVYSVEDDGDTVLLTHADMQRLAAFIDRTRDTHAAFSAWGGAAHPCSLVEVMTVRRHGSMVEARLVVLVGGDPIECSVTLGFAPDTGSGRRITTVGQPIDGWADETLAAAIRDAQDIGSLDHDLIGAVERAVHAAARTAGFL